MEKKFYLKPEFDVFSIETENMIAATLGDGDDEYIIDITDPENQGDGDADDLG